MREHACAEPRTAQYWLIDVVRVEISREADRDRALDAAPSARRTAFDLGPSAACGRRRDRGAARGMGRVRLGGALRAAAARGARPLRIPPFRISLVRAKPAVESIQGACTHEQEEQAREAACRAVLSEIVLQMVNTGSSCAHLVLSLNTPKGRVSVRLNLTVASVVLPDGKQVNAQGAVQ
jgi:hypothetical protein